MVLLLLFLARIARPRDAGLLLPSLLAPPPVHLPTAVPSVIFQEFEDGAVLFAPEREYYFGLNEVGALIWTLLPPRCASLDALCSAIAEKYPDVPGEVVRADTIELLERLMAEELAVAANSKPRAVASDATGDAPAAP